MLVTKLNLCVGLILLLSTECLGVLNKNGGVPLDDSNKVFFPIDKNNNTENNEISNNTRRKISIDPCVKITPTKPHFRDEGHSISTLKCVEYIAEMRMREDILEREDKCREKMGEEVTKKKFIQIIHNNAAKPTEYPHMAAVGWRSTKPHKWNFFCGGSLISPKYVLTAAHCSSFPMSELPNTYPEIVRLGVQNIVQKSKRQDPLDVRIHSITQHPLRDPPRKYYDIALIELETSIQFTKYIQPACLWNNLYKARHNVTVTGWGVTDTQVGVQSPDLQIGEVDIFETKYCDLLLTKYHDRKWWGFMDNQMCAGRLDGAVDTCQGDSGGPLQVRLAETKREGTIHMVIGITSFGFRCGLENRPGIYTKVSSFIEWIEEIVWPQ